MDKFNALSLDNEQSDREKLYREEIANVRLSEL